MLKKRRDDLVHSWFEDQYVTKAFKEIKDRDFETVRVFVIHIRNKLMVFSIGEGNQISVVSFKFT